MNTIPELAEDLRHHINTDNDAMRLICEHVLPLVGIDATPQELDDIREAEALAAEAEAVIDSAKSDLEDLHSGITDDELTLSQIAARLRNIIDDLDTP